MGLNFFNITFKKDQIFFHKMVLYEADISNIAKPVKSMKNTKSPGQTETPRKPKRKDGETIPKKNLKKVKQEEEVEESTEEIEVPVEKVPKKKKKMETIIESDESDVPVVTKKKSKKVQEASPPPEEKVVKKRKAVKAEKVVQELSPAPEEKPVKKRKVSKKEVEPEPVKVEPEPVKRKKVVRDPAVPPLWFEKYVQGVKKEEALAKQEKVSAKTVKQEAQETAKKSWDDGLTRDRVTNEVDNHMSRMYSMIFSRR